MSNSPSSNLSTYVYCVTAAEPFSDGAPPIRAQAIGGMDYPVYTLQFMDLVAVVSDTPESRYDVSRQNTMAHQLVVEEAMTRSEILPVRFGTVAKSAQDIQEKLLKRKFGELHRLLHHIHGRVELGLKVFWNRERVFAELAAENDRIRMLRDELAGRSQEETHYQRIQLGQLIEEAIIRRRDRDAEAIVELVRPLAVEMKTNKILTDMMVLNAAFLVDKTREPEFDAKVKALDADQADRLILKYVGPLPPYNFVHVVVHWEED